ncbi:MAG: nickel pincer cofactor biosynthesis protein LarB [Clostridiales Family XIII bacterium]|nr:nickel pincer cofactor biosynthesis protein LarB [Clostridiales Family XIII bacterium]
MRYDDIGFAKIDTDRARRTGRAEVIFGLGKTAEQVAEILARLAEREALVIATKVTPEQAAAARSALTEGLRAGVTYYEVPRMLVWRRDFGLLDSRDSAGVLSRVAVVCGGTADIPVAEEAALTAELYGCAVSRHFDVGVAGIHRLLDCAEEIRAADVVVAVAGMEGALASVVGGLVAVPVIAVPTSVGYGSSMGGLAALLAMLNSCSLGVSVVNIDNGFGAGYLASLIAK